MDVMQGLVKQPEKIGNYGYDRPWTGDQLLMVAVFVLAFIGIVGPALIKLMFNSIPDATADHELHNGRP